MVIQTKWEQVCITMSLTSILLEVEAIQGYIYKCAKHHLETPYLDMAYTFYTLITSKTPNQIDILGESFIKEYDFSQRNVFILQINSLIFEMRLLYKF